MKTLKLLVLLTLSASFVLSSCNKDDDDPSFEEQLEGVWFVVKLEYTNCPDTSDNEVFVLPATCDTERCIRFTFNQDGTLVAYSVSGPDEEETMTGTFTGDEDNVTMCLSGDCVSGPINIDGDLAIFEYEEDGCDVFMTFNR